MGASGICLAKCSGPGDVQRLEWKLEELERRRGLAVGSIAVHVLIETAKGVMTAYPSAMASKRVNALIFGAVDYTKDMRVKLSKGKSSSMPAHAAVAARAAGSLPSTVRSWRSRMPRASRRAPVRAGRWAMRDGC